MTFGIAYQANDDLSIMLDYRKINYTDVGSVSNAGQVPLLFGMSGGPGFGWDDVKAVKLGVEWAASDTLTWRFGYASNDNPIGPEDVNLNIIAPGVVTKHISTGLELDLGEGDAFEFMLTYVPEETVSGPGLLNPNHIVNLAMDQLIVGISWTINME
jgi:long-chain fatty acid transport protein